MSEPIWLAWAKELQNIAQNGLAYSRDDFDIERFKRIREISVEIMSKYTDIGTEKIKELFCNEKGYQTPKVDVRGVVIQGDKMLLVKETSDGKWSLPGGWADYNLSARENVVKEFHEEAGLEVTADKLIAVLDRNKHNEPPFPYGIYKMFVSCTIIGGEFQDNIETEESGFFSIDNLPPLSVDRITEGQIKMCFDWASSDSKETIFD